MDNIKTTHVPLGTKGILQRMALKDVNGDPSVNAGLKRTLIKGKMSECLGWATPPCNPEVLKDLRNGDFEPNMSDKCQHEGKVSGLDLVPKNFAEVSLNASHTGTPLYRSFFADECQDIINQIKSAQPEARRSPGKRKVEQMDVSTIDAEPLPYDGTLLGCEVSQVLCSLENSPIKEELSLCAENPLSLSYMQRNGFNSSYCGFKNNKGCCVGDGEGLSPIHGPGGVCLKKQKTEALEKVPWGLNEMSPSPDERDTCPNTTEDIELPPTDIEVKRAPGSAIKNNTTVDETSALNTTNVIEVLPQISITAEDVPHIQAPANITMEMVPSGNSTQDIAVAPDDAMPGVIDVLPLPANTTFDITEVIEGPQFPVNVTQDFPSMSEGKLANTTHDIELVPNAAQEPSVQGEVAPNAAQEPSVQGEVPKANTTLVIGMFPLMQKSSVEVPSTDTTILVSCNDHVLIENCDTLESSDSSQKTAPSDNDASPPVDMVVDVPAQCSLVTEDIALPGCTGTNTEMPPSHNSDLIVENKKDLSVSKPDTEPEVNDVKDPETQTSPDVTCVLADPSTLVSPATEEHRPEGCGQNGIRAGMEAGEDPKPQSFHSDCSRIQEEESSHDVSVFSIGSLSFVTSTPVPGLNNFQFQKANVSIGSVSDEAAHKVPRLQGKIPQPGYPDASAVACNDKGKASAWPAEVISLKRSIAPLPKAVPPTSGIPSARRSLALCQNPAAPKPAPRGIPGRGTIRPPMVRQGVPRPSLGNPTQAMEGTGGSNVTNKVSGIRSKNPKAASAIVKVKSSGPHSPPPAPPAAVKPPSRLGAPGASGRPSTGGQNAARPSSSTGIRTGLPRPGTSSITRPLPHSQRVSPKHQKSLQGLTTKQNRRELPTLRRDIVSKTDGTLVGRSSAKPETLASGTAKVVCAEATVQIGEVQASPSSEGIAATPAIPTEFAESRDESCNHIQTCSCCCERYNKLLQKCEELTRRLGQFQPTE